MATIRQIEANRRNAQSSTGPKSAEGKAASSHNALKQGIFSTARVLPGGDAAAVEALALSYYDTVGPVGPVETFLVDTMIDADCQRRRLRNTQSQLENELAKEFDEAPENTLGRVFQKDCTSDRLLDKVFGRQQAVQRN